MTFQVLETHLKRKLANHSWYENCLEGNSAAFPYQLGDSAGKVIPAAFFPKNTNFSFPPITEADGQPRFVINIPSLFVTESPKKIATLIDLFTHEAFQDPQSSLDSCKKRVIFVIGFNRRSSLDKQVNAWFKKQVETFSVNYSIQTVSIFGFFWEPKWRCNNPSPHLYSAKKCYLLMKALLNDQSKIDAIRAALEPSATTGQIPYQEIRQRLLRSKATLDAVAFFKKQASPLYFGVMDDDLLKLNHVMHWVDQTVLMNTSPVSAITFGYRLPPSEAPALRWAVHLDMAVREAMNRVIKFSGYPPEPASFFLYSDKLSFIGDGNALENKRLIERGRALGLFINSGFGSFGGSVTIQTPARMRHQKLTKHKAFTVKDLKQKATLLGFRGLPQTHATPLKWAEGIYFGLNRKISDYKKVCAVISRIFAAYDPINRIFSIPGTYSPKHFKNGLARQILNAAEKSMIQIQKAELNKWGYTADEVELIEKAAIASTDAMRAVFNQALKELPQKS